MKPTIEFGSYGAASEEDLRALRSKYPQLPEDYFGYLKASNGGEGFIGDNYLILWRAEEIERFNREYEVASFAPDLVLFGSSGGGEGYGFDLRQLPPHIVSVPFVGMGTEYTIPIGTTFSEFLSLLERGLK